MIIATRDGAEQTLVLSERVLSTGSGHVSGLLTAVAAAWAMGVPADAIGMRIDSAIRDGEV